MTGDCCFTTNMFRSWMNVNDEFKVKLPALQFVMSFLKRCA